MNQHNKTFATQLHNSPACDIISVNKGRYCCPGCGALLARTGPTTKVVDLLLYCRRCRMQVNVNIANQSAP